MATQQTNKQMNIYEVVTQLVGWIMPVGETHADNARFENLKEMTALVDKLISDIDVVASFKNAHEYSIKRAGEHASNFLTKLGIEE